MTQHPETTILSINGKTPHIDESAFIAPGCRIIGDVTIGPDVSIWYNCVIRADVSSVVIGARSNVQDGSVIHCDGPTPMAPDGFPTIIGEDVLIGHMAMVHGCTIHDRGFIGLGAIIMNGCVVESDAMLGAGALLPEGKHMAQRELWVGRPAKRLRELPDAALVGMKMGVAHYVENGYAHKKAIAEAEGLD
ncbi:gamma carbonic anhydrase family protein [Alterisphingorhabdus coralli]|uniref:Gamma carbonic anhydrase family protein n=1 Tax=Alterisphingorhabdus coralli TaxID=3071408 RepID=A0AA97I1G0_9SPHN|nr:gamma carbonic anhydrase family protein [Parasphingorhabdus sp. SCSIO 66989]WOE75255.1 gamma carbonic anhydrase family protein [Parasphingorhabdus sp. SCSIO 66989]